MAQRRPPNPITQGRAAIEAARKSLIEARSRKEAAGAVSAKERARFARDVKKATDAELKTQLSTLRAVGLYTTKLAPEETRLVLTRGRKQRIRAAYKQFEDLQRHTIFAAYPSAKPAEKKRIGAVVKKSGGTVTRRGIFIKRDEGEMKAGDTKLIKERDTGLYKIVQTNRYTTKTGERRTVTAELYLEGADALERQEKTLRRKFDRAVKGMGKDERIRFVIGGPNGNVSRASFASWEAFLRYAKGYRRDPRAQATFMASLTVYVTARERPGSRTYRVPVAWVDKSGRRHEAAPENLYEGGLFPAAKPRKAKRRGMRKTRE